VLSYARLMQLMAEELGLRRRLVLPVPVLTPRLSSLWIHLVTPLSAAIARPLAEGLRNRVVCRDDLAQRLMPQELLGRGRPSAPPWPGRAAPGGDPLSMAGPVRRPRWAGGTVFTDRRHTVVEAPLEATWRALSRIGGDNGWYGADWLWRVRGAIDRLAGGPGLRRGRRDRRPRLGRGPRLLRVTGVDARAA